MNRNLENIVQLISQPEPLTEEQKAAIVKALTDADRELTVTAFKLERTEKVKHTTAILLEETIAELEQKRMAVEAQNRELEIETSLERIRTVAMGMNKTDDVLHICRVMFTELQSLGFSEIRNALINFWDDEHNALLDYDYADYSGGHIAHIPYNSHPTFEQFQQRIKSATDAFAELIVQEDELESWRERRRNSGEYEDPRLDNISALYYYFYSIGVGAIGISTFSALPDEKLRILKRFRNVFELAYRRYVDIQQAEAQAREAQIQLALERVRARTMAMQKSEELSEAASLLFQQVKSLGIATYSSGFTVWENNDRELVSWMCNADGSINPPFRMPADEIAWHTQQYASWKNKEDYIIHDFTGKEMQEHYRYLRSFPLLEEAFKKSEAAGVATPVRQVHNAFNFSHGNLLFITLQPVPESYDIFKRFAKVFEQTYTRFLDLQKAEAQAREAQIEAALERVRSSAMAMHNSNELADVARVMFNQIRMLGGDLFAFGIVLCDKQENTVEQWHGLGEGEMMTPFRVPVDLDYIHRFRYDQWKAGVELFSIEIPSDYIAQHFQLMFELPSVKAVMDNLADKGISVVPPSWEIDYGASFRHGYLLVSSYKPFLENKIFPRFAKVFEQAYTRFLDLQKAEAQAREAQIEAALEKIRSRSLAMHHSEEIKHVVFILFEKLHELKLVHDTVAIQLFDFKTKDSLFWPGNTLQEEPPRVWLPYDETMMKEDTCHKDLWDAMSKGEIIFNKVYSKEQKDRWFQYVFAHNDFNIIHPHAREFIVNAATHTVCFIPEKNSALFVDSFDGKLYSEENMKVLQRAAKVFEQAYVRFLDLQKAEAQAREAQIEAALERVRSRSMAMHKSEELKEVIRVVLEQFVHLNINVEHAGFYIDYKTNDDMHIWLADPNLDPFYAVIPYFDAPTWKSFLDAKTSGKSFYTDLLDFKTKNKFYHSLFKLFQVPEAAKEFYLECKGLAVSTVLLDNVGLYIENFSAIPYTDQENQILMRFGKVFQQTYTRFLDLQKAEAQAREAQIQLALERVRARTMAMQRSEELKEVVKELYEQLRVLGFQWGVASIVLMDKATGDLDWWMEGFDDGYDLPERYHVPFFEHPGHREQLEHWIRGHAYAVIEISGTEKHAYDRYYFNETDFAKAPEQSKQLMMQQPAVLFSMAYMQYGSLTWSPTPLSEEQAGILQRFAREFEQTYTRFLDLQKAEAQAREAQVQLALERVRARTMAMHKSSELSEVAILLFDQLRELGASLWICGFNICNKNNEIIESWMSPPDGKIMPPMFIPYSIDPFYEIAYNNWEKGIELYSDYKEDPELREEHEKLLHHPSMKQALNHLIEVNIPIPKAVHRFAVTYRYGYLMVVTTQPFTETNIFIRIAKVFEQTYTRFLDLQRAEAQAREAQIEAALEKVRSRSLAMHKSDELREVIIVVFEKLREMGLPFENAGIQLYTAGSKDIVQWVAAPGLIATPVLASLPFIEAEFAASEIMQDIWAAKEYGKNICSKQYSFEEKNRFFAYAGKYNDLNRIPAEAREIQMRAPGYTQSLIAEKNSAIWVDSYSGQHISVEDFNMLGRFARVFEQAYTRFLDLQKAEAQAREAQIEAALERVRAASMAMHNSKELVNVSTVLYKQLISLGFDSVFSGGFNFPDKENNVQKCWLAETEHGIMNDFVIKLSGDKVLDERIECREKNVPFLEQILIGREVREHLDFLFPPDQDTPEVKASKDAMPVPTVFSIRYLKEGYMILISDAPLNEEQKSIMERFASVFNMAYTRFLDLQKAEANAREANIEAALERVRSRTMAMHKSSELTETAELLFDQCRQLGAELQGVAFAICNANSSMVKKWTSIGIFSHPYNIEPGEERMYEAWKNQAGLYEEVYEGERQKKYYETFMQIPAFKQGLQKFIDSGYPLPTWQKNHAVTFKYGYLLFITTKPFNETEVFLRFGKVFEQTYTRFLDLQKAEAQAREAQIEAALERVRARAMAMHSSQELSEVVHELRKQMGVLGQKDLETCVIHLHDESPNFIHSWAAIKPPEMEGEILESTATVPKKGLMIIEEAMEAYSSNRQDYIIINEGEKLRQWFSFLEKASPQGYNKLVESVHGEIEDLRAFWSFSDFAGGSLLMVTMEQPGEQSRSLLRRFANVFGLAYRRFADLKQAEAQAREAQIEAALEKIRSSSLAMHQSHEIINVVKVLFDKLKDLGLEFDGGAAIHVFREGNRNAEIWVAAPDDVSPNNRVSLPFDEASYDNNPIIQDVWHAWSTGTDIVNKTYSKAEKDRYFQYVFKHNNTGVIPGTARYLILNTNSYTATFIAEKNCLLGAVSWTSQVFTEAQVTVLKRIARVFEQAYVRFLDLQKAEAQAKEAIRRSSVDRVRAEIASMRTTEDLQRITPLIWRELTTLGVPFFRCGVFIMNELEQKTHVYLSTPDGKPLAALHLDFDSSDTTLKASEHWRQQKIYTTHWDRDQFIAWVQSLVGQGQITTPVSYQGGETPPDSLTLQFVPFAQGMLYIGSADPLTEDQVELVQALAEAFSVAYARYEDFRKLEAAKEQIEATYNELRHTQKQLIQSEKMASLGELTAGIAHEIQNPLNFVNNFSEINTELIDELKTELATGNLQLASEIADDIKANETKISHHGKRADAIVKGMLQHSRSSTGVKEPTDLNALADEYLRLAYHGLRAKDKSFNATFETHFDTSMGKVSVVPQDIGRVILNIINNAFYAVSERKKMNSEGYEPMVTLTTQQLTGKAEIRIRDNGPGIPQKMVDKIFQPFFTTKPTGQGTGLGLSLSYDIVKAHGGEITVKTQEGAGTELCIVLPAAEKL